jgi:uncharacterized protein YxjI
MTTPANWYPDPSQRFQLRYRNGTDWTEHVSTNGVAGVDHLPTAVVAGQQVQQVQQVLPAQQGQIPSEWGAQQAAAQAAAQAEKVRLQVTERAGIVGAASGGGTLFTEPVLVVNQKAKIIEVTNQYTVFNSAGQQICTVNEVGQSTAKKVLRVLTNVDQFLTHKYEIKDNAGQLQMGLHRPAKVFKSSVIVSGPGGQEIGTIVQENMIGKIHFGFMVGGQKIGAIRAENWRAWNFSIEDATGREVARVTKTWEGVLKAAFTTADNYVLQIHEQLPQPLLSLVVASALCIDTALKQDDRG